MEKITDLQHYGALTKNIKKHCGTTLNNCFYMADDIKRLTSESRLYFELFDCTLLILQDEESYWQAGFISAPDSKTTLLHLDKTCVTSLIQRGDVLTEKNRALKKIAEGFGFGFTRCYRLYELALEGKDRLLNKKLSDLVKETEGYGLQIVPFNDKYTESIHRLWNICLDQGTVCRHDWDEGTKNSALVIDTGKNNRLCGVYMPKIEGKEFSIWHLAVDPEYRSRKLAQLLTLFLFNQAANSGFEKVSNWIADDNIASVKLHEKMGMKATQKVSFRLGI